jgi:hypothetical protein
VFVNEMLRLCFWFRLLATNKLSGGLESGPLVLFDQMDNVNVLIISPLSNFMASTFVPTNSSLSWGIMGGVDVVPEGFKHETILFHSSNGINQVAN